MISRFCIFDAAKLDAMLHEASYALPWLNVFPDWLNALVTQYVLGCYLTAGKTQSENHPRTIKLTLSYRPPPDLYVNIEVERVN